MDDLTTYPPEVPVTSSPEPAANPSGDLSRKDFLVKTGVVAAAVAGVAGLDPGRALAAPAVLRNRSEPITLQYWQLGSVTAAEENYWKRLAIQYPKVRPNVKVVVTDIPNYTSSNKLTASFAAGVGPDLFAISAGDLLRYVTEGITQPLNKYMTAGEINDFQPSALKAMEVNGKIVYLKNEVEPLLLYYDKQLFNEKGLTPPKTWEEMVDLAIKLKTPQRAGIAIETLPDVYQNFTFYPFIWQGGGNVVDDAWTHAEIDGPAGVAALQLWGDIVHKYKVCPAKFVVRTFDITILAKRFAAMQVSGNWAVAQFQSQFPTFEFGVAPLPYPASGHPQTIYGGWGVATSSQSKYVDEAARFTVWTSAGTDKASAQRGVDLVSHVLSDMSPRKSVTKLQEEQGFFSMYPFNIFLNDIYPTALPEPRYTPEIIQAVSAAIQAVQFGGVSGKSAAATAARAINTYLKSYKGAH